MAIVRKVLLTHKEFKIIEDYKNKWLQRGLETGGYVFGKLYPNGLAEVKRVIDGGPKAERSPVSFSGDNENATRVKEELQREDPEISLLGEYHVHPWEGPSNLSAGDIKQLKEAKKQRPWLIVFLNTKDDFKIWDVEIEYTSPPRTTDSGCTFQPKLENCFIRNVPYQVVKTEVGNKEYLLNRILKITEHDILIEKTVLIVGLGSGGSTIAKYLGCTGIGRMILVDDEELEVANLIRHEGGIEEVGKPKVEVCKHLIESHNPFAVVETHNFDAAQDFTKLEKIASECDLIVGSSGSNRVNNLLNKLSVEMKIPALFGGVYEKARGGYVLAVKPFETACYNCLFGLTSGSYSVDREAVKRYGLDEDELHQQQGLWIDVSFPSLILSKMVLAVLENEQLVYNLVLYDSSLEIKKLKASRREDCAVCNEEKWSKKTLENNVRFKGD
jgi:molybdopterin/thiamine biosynthesis adenylyltransferase